MVANYRSVLAHLAGTSDPAERDRAEALLATAKVRVAARHADLHDTHRRRLVDATTNRTFYQFGYLYMADTLCYWQRELDQAGALLGDSTAVPGTCLF